MSGYIEQAFSVSKKVQIRDGTLLIGGFSVPVASLFRQRQDFIPTQNLSYKQFRKTIRKFSSKDFPAASRWKLDGSRLCCSF